MHLLAPALIFLQLAGSNAFFTRPRSRTEVQSEPPEVRSHSPSLDRLKKLLPGSSFSPPDDEVFAPSAAYKGFDDNVPALKVKINQNVLDSGKELLYGMIFAENRWQTLASRFLPTDMAFSVSGVQIKVKEPHILDLAKPNPATEKLQFVEHEGIQMKFDDVRCEFETDFEINTAARSLMAGHVRVLLKQVSFEATLQPFIQAYVNKTTGEIWQGYVIIPKDVVVKFGEYPTITITKSYANFLQYIYNIAEYFFGNMMRPTIEDLIAKAIVSQLPSLTRNVGIEGVVQGLRAIDETVNDQFGTQLNVKENFQLVNQKILLHPTDMSFSTDIKLNLPRAPAVRESHKRAFMRRKAYGRVRAESL